MNRMLAHNLSYSFSLTMKLLHYSNQNVRRANNKHHRIKSMLLNTNDIPVKSPLTILIGLSKKKIAKINDVVIVTITYRNLYISIEFWAFIVHCRQLAVTWTWLLSWCAWVHQDCSAPFLYRPNRMKICVSPEIVNCIAIRIIQFVEMVPQLRYATFFVLSLKFSR